MNWKTAISRTGAAAAAAVLGACATVNTSGGHWQQIGESVNGNIRYEIDTDSIRRQGNLVTFRDKKTVSDIKQERFTDTPPYKVALNNWEIDCGRKTFRLTAMQLLDARGNTVGNAQYTATQMRPMGVIRGSASEKQYQAVCGKPL